MKQRISKFSKPPYYAVIFTSIRTEIDEGYAEMALEMETLVKQQPGFLEFDSAREKTGITISYWKDLESIKKWRENAAHKLAQTKGKGEWYKYYSVKIAKVEKEYGFGYE